MIKKLITGTFILIGIANFSNAQNMPIFGQNYINRFSVSPAFAGYNQNTEVFVGFRQNMVGIDGAYKTMALDINGKAAENMGFGVSIIDQKSGNFNQLFAAATYAYHINMGADMGLSMAISPAVFKNSYNLAGATTYGSTADPVLQNQAGLSASTFDAGVGIMFHWTQLYVSLNMPRTICSDLSYPNAVFNYDRTLNATVSYELENGDFEICPMADLWYAFDAGADFRATVAAKYKKKFWAAASYMSQGYIGIGAGVAATDRIVVNYQYEAGTTDLAKNCLGTHEVSVGFLVARAKTRKTPTIFPPIEENNVATNKEKKNEEQLNKKIETLEKEIKALEEKIKNQPQNNNQQSNTTPSNNQNTTPTNNQNNNNNQTNQNDKPNNDPNWGPEVIMKNVVYGFGSNTPTASTKAALDRYVYILKNENRKLQIKVQVDNLGSKKYNEKIALQRAEAIKAYLISKGVKAEQIYTKSDENKVSGNLSTYARFTDNIIKCSIAN